MSLNRYASDNLVKNGSLLSTNSSIQRIRDAIKSGQITTTTHVIKEGDRLDILAGKLYGDGRLWWILAAASGIGWWLQVPPGTRIVVPTDLSVIEGLV
jgi:nucleoid-associated protein YgaU